MPAKKPRKFEKTYEVEVVIAVRYLPETDEELSYKVKWWGYPDSENSWEPAGILTDGCQEMLGSLWEIMETNKGLTRKNFSKQHEAVDLPQDWIERQRRRFVDVYGRDAKLADSENWENNEGDTEEGHTEEGDTGEGDTEEGDTEEGDTEEDIGRADAYLGVDGNPPSPLTDLSSEEED